MTFDPQEAERLASHFAIEADRMAQGFGGRYKGYTYEDQAANMLRAAAKRVRELERKLYPGQGEGVSLAVRLNDVKEVALRLQNRVRKLEADKEALIEAMAETEAEPNLTLAATRWNKLVDKRTENYLRAARAEKVVEVAREACDPPTYSEANYQRTCDLLFRAIQEYDDEA